MIQKCKTIQGEECNFIGCEGRRDVWNFVLLSVHNGVAIKNKVIGYIYI